MAETLTGIETQRLRKPQTEKQAGDRMAETLTGIETTRLSLPWVCKKQYWAIEWLKPLQGLKRGNSIAPKLSKKRSNG